jgi:methionine aminopeptidase
MASTGQELLMLCADYTLNNPDTLTKYKTAAQISEKVLAEVSKLAVAGAKIVEVCQKGDKLIEEELGKVYRGKKITKGAITPSPVFSLPN